MIATSKLNNSIVFSLAIFWGPRADEMGAEGWGPEGRGPRIRAESRESRNTNTLFLQTIINFVPSRKMIKIFTLLSNEVSIIFSSEHLFFSFSQTFLLINSISFSFEPWIFWQLPSCFQISSYFLSIFWMLWMLVTEIYTMKDIDNVYGVRYITK